MNKIRIGIAGYGNLGKGVELAVAQNEDMEDVYKRQGFTIRIKNAPKIHPIKAPKTGISAVNATSTPMSSAYGNPSSHSVTTNIQPRISASTHLSLIHI